MRYRKVMKVTGTQGRLKDKPGHYLLMRAGCEVARSRRRRGKIATSGKVIQPQDTLKTAG